MTGLLKFSSKWLLIAGVTGILAGSASALFLAGLEWVTAARVAHPWLLWLLPAGGALVSFIYLKAGKEAGRGNNLIIEQIHNGGGAIPLRMAPFVLSGTLVTHLLGGSAGREGTAVQMGGSLAEAAGKAFRLAAPDRKIILMCGISAGFGSVFGTPLAGTLFGLEVLAIGLLSYEALLPCFIASYTGHLVTTAWGIRHIHYSMEQIPPLSVSLLVKLILASILFGLAAMLFVQLTRRLKAWFGRWLVSPPLRSAAGGVIIIALVYLLGTRDYLGLSLPLLQHSFQEAASPLDFLLKTIFTSITLGAGFQGGEVTPLFVIGAALGSALGGLLSVSVPLLAAVGLVAVFGGAAKTPIACFVMGIELFGADGAVYLFLGCIVSFLFSGRAGIYESQKRGAAG
ncbi:voltage-gated chloride channel family protein [Paenibacillus vietnamensis]|uniref:voltage-gated chloride channel family protein n=1 Tax=Paenibacillus vietnamensis TaxID=2590547 RepID=UPI001CD16F4C|nr:voltage-gated chloride channel family protein [Paenibacillus vietnamensis]